MNTKSLILVGLIAFFFFGCVNITYNQKVDRDGNSIISEKIDLGPLLALSNQSASMASQMSDPCANLTDAGVTCTYSNSTITITRAFKLSDGKYKFTKKSEFPNVVYTIELNELPTIINSSSSTSLGDAGTSGDFNSSSAKSAALTLSGMRTNITYIVEMPGEVYSAENGQIKNGKAEYDIVSLMSNGKNIIVKSKELDMMLLAIIGGSFVLLVGGVILVIVFMKASKK
jgi:hypothetical protein